MAPNLGFVFFLLFSSPFSADGVFPVNSGFGTGRNLLQAKKSCPVNFLSSRTARSLQASAKDRIFLPPSAALLSRSSHALSGRISTMDGSNDCASMTFSYINQYGKYPVDLFASECQGNDKIGLACDGGSNQTASANGGQGDESVTVTSLA